jgi:hypothetical protein
MARIGRIVLTAAWILWMAKGHGDTLTWAPLRTFPDRGPQGFTPQQYCELQLEAFRGSRLDLAQRLKCLPAGVPPQ